MILRTKIMVSSGPVLEDHLPSGELKGDLYHTHTGNQTPNLWVRRFVSKFPYRFPLSYALLLELRSFYHRTRLLSKRGDVRQPQMGLAWETSALGHLIPNIRTQTRIRDMQRLLSSQPWLSPEDWHLFLIGWDAGSEYSEREDRADTQERSAC
jgi:hypothetical protein